MVYPAELRVDGAGAAGVALAVVVGADGCCVRGAWAYRGQAGVL